MRALLSMLLALSLSVVAGCAMTEEGENVLPAKRGFRLPGTGPDIGAADPGDNPDEWSEVGQMGRGDQPIEKEYDNLLDFRSDKRKAIERNLGIE